MKHTTFTFFFLLLSFSAFSFDNQVVWNIDNLASIGGYTVAKTGNPTVKTIDGKQAIEFNPSITSDPSSGTGDRIQVQGNPLGTTATSFTIEMIFKPYTTNTSLQPRVFHICDKNNTSNAPMMTLETRYSGTGSSWYGDFFVREINTSGYMNPSQTYDADKWMHMAMTYDLSTNTMKGYINGELQNFTATGTYSGLNANTEVSLGARMQGKYYFKGAIAKVIFTDSALTPNEFTYDGIVTDTKNIFKDKEGYSFVVNNSVILYSIPQAENIQIDIYNITAQKVKTLVNNKIDVGNYEISTEKENLPAGIYLYVMQTSGGFRASQKVMKK